MSQSEANRAPTKRQLCVAFRDGVWHRVDWCDGAASNADGEKLYSVAGAKASRLGDLSGLSALVKQWRAAERAAAPERKAQAERERRHAMREDDVIRRLKGA